MRCCCAAAGGSCSSRPVRSGRRSAAREQASPSPSPPCYGAEGRAAYSGVTDRVRAPSRSAPRPSGGRAVRLRPRPAGDRRCPRRRVRRRRRTSATAAGHRAECPGAEVTFVRMPVIRKAVFRPRGAARFADDLLGTVPRAAPGAQAGGRRVRQHRHGAVLAGLGPAARPAGDLPRARGGAFRAATGARLLASPFCWRSRSW